MESDLAASERAKEESKAETSVEKQEVVVSGKTAQILVNEQQEELPSIADFHNNDSKILAVLNEPGSNYSFRGLMRKLSLHQQSLIRALHRLEEMGLVERSSIGYKLSKGGQEAFSKVNAKIGKGEYIQLLQTYIPVNIQPKEVVRELVGRWFKNLRWLGLIESETVCGYTLQWTSDDGSFQITLRIISDYIVIETNASAEQEKVQAMTGSYAIYEQITKVLQSKLGAYVMQPQYTPGRYN